MKFFDFLATFEVVAGLGRMLIVKLYGERPD
jgi:hypothetical protein